MYVHVCPLPHLTPFSHGCVLWGLHSHLEGACEEALGLSTHQIMYIYIYIYNHVCTYVYICIYIYIYIERERERDS